MITLLARQPKTKMIRIRHDARPHRLWAENPDQYISVASGNGLLVRRTSLLAIFRAESTQSVLLSLPSRVGRTGSEFPRCALDAERCAGGRRACFDMKRRQHKYRCLLRTSADAP